jgi:RecA/RadA recombinase
VRFSFKEAVARAKGLATISTGSKTIDSLIGGGMRCGELLHVFGHGQSGKSQLAAQAALSAASEGQPVLYIDTEGSFRPERLSSLAAARNLDFGSLGKMIYRLRAPNSKVQTMAVRDLGVKPELKDCRLVVVDTLTANFGLEYPGKSNTPKRQGMLSVHLGEMSRDAYLNQRAYLLTNRVTISRPGEGGEEVHVGGATVLQMVQKSVRLVRAGGNLIASLLEGDTVIRSAVVPTGEAGLD